MEFNPKLTKSLSKYLQKLDENIYFSDFCNQFLNKKIDLLDSQDPKEELLKEIKKSLPDDEFNFLNEKLTLSIQKQDPKIYASNWFITTLNKKECFIGDCELGSETISRGEMFLCDDVRSSTSKYYEEEISIGYFDKDVEYPSIRQNGKKWMSIVPHEIASMERPIKEAEGNVLVLGLGIGYYALSVAKKSNVKSVTVIEWSQSIIDIFNKVIAPCFRESNKIKIIKGDAFKSYKTMQESFDYCFADIWFNESDGLVAYSRLKRNEKIPTSYWMEAGILAFLRRITLICIDSILNDYTANFDESLNEIVSQILRKLSKKKIIDKSDLEKLLSDEGLKELLID